MAQDDVMKGLILSALQDETVQNIFEGLMDQCRGYDEIEGLTTSYRDTVLEQIAGSVSSILLKKSSTVTTLKSGSLCHDVIEERRGECEETPHEESIHNANDNTNNTHAASLQLETKQGPATKQQDSPITADDGFDEGSDDAAYASQLTDSETSNEQKTLCRKILVALKSQTEEDKPHGDSETQGNCWNLELTSSESSGLTAHERTPYGSFLKANGCDEKKPTNTAASTTWEHTATPQKERTDVDACALTNDGPSPQMESALGDEETEDDSSENFQSVADHMEETGNLCIIRDGSEEYLSVSGNDDDDDVESWYSSDGINLSRTSSAGYITATNSVEEVKTEARKEIRDNKTIRPQFLGSLYLKHMANAKETAAEIRARKPEPRIQIEKPVRLDTDLMYAVRQSLTRSLPMIAGKNNLSALMTMADGMFDEMSLDRDLDDLAWPVDPLAELRESGLALVDYMDPTSSTSDVTSATETRMANFENHDWKLKQIPKTISIPFIFAKFNGREEDIQPAPSNDASSNKSQIIHINREHFWRDQIKSPLCTLRDRFREVLDQMKSPPQLPLMEIQSTCIPKIEIARPTATDETNDSGYTTNEMMSTARHSETSVDLSNEDETSKSLQTSTNHQLLKRSINGDAHVGFCVASKIRPQFVGNLYLEKFLNVFQTESELKTRKPLPKLREIDGSDFTWGLQQTIKHSLSKVPGKNKLSAVMTMADVMMEEMSLDQHDVIALPIDALAELKASGLALVDYMDPQTTKLGHNLVANVIQLDEEYQPSLDDSKHMPTDEQNHELDRSTNASEDEGSPTQGQQELVPEENEASLQVVEIQELPETVGDSSDQSVTLHQPSEMGESVECHQRDVAVSDVFPMCLKDEDSLSDDSAIGEDGPSTPLSEENDNENSGQTLSKILNISLNEILSSKLFATQNNSGLTLADNLVVRPLTKLPTLSKKIEEKVSIFEKFNSDQNDSENVMVDHLSPPKVDLTVDIKSRVELFEAFQKPNASAE